MFNLLKPFSLLTCWILLSLLSRGLGAESVNLYLLPDETLDPLATLSADDVRLTEDKAVLDEAMRDLGWHWMEYTFTYTGFVENSSIGKDLEVAVGALVRLNPDLDSPVIATVEEGDNATFIRANDWAEILITKAMPVYFIKTVLRGFATPLEEQAGFDSGSAASGLGAAAPASPQLTRAPAVSYAPGTPPSETWEDPVLYTRYFVGTLERTTSRFGLRRKYQYQLMDGNDRRIAFVTVISLLNRGAIEDFIDRQVLVFGDARPVKRSKALLLYARIMRLKD